MTTCLEPRCHSAPPQLGHRGSPGSCGVTARPAGRTRTRAATRRGPSPRAPGTDAGVTAHPAPAMVPKRDPDDERPDRQSDQSHRPAAVPDGGATGHPDVTCAIQRCHGSERAGGHTTRGSQSGPIRRCDASQRIAVVPRRTGRARRAPSPPCARMRVALARGSTVEHLTLDQGVIGSNPIAPAIPLNTKRPLRRTEGPSFWVHTPVRPLGVSLGADAEWVILHITAPWRDVRGRRTAPGTES